MSHFLTVVLCDDDQDVERLLAPYDVEGRSPCLDGRWDWWVVGGRWRGWLRGYDPAKDPQNQVACGACLGVTAQPYLVARADAYWRRVLDQARGRRLSLCGTVNPAAAAAVVLGDEVPRPRNVGVHHFDTQVEYLCVRCGGTGHEVKPPHLCAPHDGDIGTTEDLAAAVTTAGYAPQVVVTPDGQWHEECPFGTWEVSASTDLSGLHVSERAWAAAALGISERWPNRTAVVVDCHL